MTSIKELRGSSPKLGKIKALRHSNGQDAPGKVKCYATGGSVIDSGNNEMGGGFTKTPSSKPSKMRGGGKFGKKAGSKPGKPGKDDKAAKGGATINIAIMSGTKPPGPGGMPDMGMPGPPPGVGGPPPGAGGPPPGGPPKPPMMGRASGGRVSLPKMAGHSRAKP
jgi:hypothetical protein